MISHTDQLGRTITLSSVPKRIISIVPSQTELLFYLGLDEEVVGITKFCVHPESKFNATSKVGGTKQLDLEKIKALKPDLIIANKEENERSQVEELMDICPVWISDINDLDSALGMIERVGVLVDRAVTGELLTNQIKREFTKHALPLSRLCVAYFIWRDPYMAAGVETFIDAMLAKCGLNNAFADLRYPEITNEALVDANPDVVLLSSEPYPFKEKQIAEISALLPRAIIKLVDGELFSWYGNRLLLTPAYFAGLMNEINSSKSEKH